MSLEKSDGRLKYFHGSRRRVPVEKIQPSIAVFTSAQEAIRFAVMREGSAPRPAMARIADKTRARAPLTPTEAAAQAGMVMQAIAPIGKLQTATLVARSVPSSVTCQCNRLCCSGKKINIVWQEAINTIAEHVLPPIVPKKLSFALRAALVLKIYVKGKGKGISYAKIAEDFHLDTDTVSKHHRSVVKWLNGSKSAKDAESVPGLEPHAWEEAESLLRDAGIVGDTTE